MTVISSTSYALYFKRDGLLQPGETVILGRNDTMFKVCNRTKDTLQIAIIYKHHWKYGEPATWPAKGWFIYSPGECANVAVNTFFGIMSVVRVTKDGKLEPYFSVKATEVSLKEVRVDYNEVKKFATEYFCTGKAPFDEYRDKIIDYRKCDKGQIKIPFNVMFSHGGGKHFTFSINP